MNLFFKLFFSAFALFFLSGCKKSNDIKGEDKEALQASPFLVDKIYDYHDRLLAEYVYSEEDQLIRRSAYDPVSYPGIKILDQVFSYTEERISHIEVINYTHPQFSHYILITYDDEGNIKRDETYKDGGIMQGYNNYIYRNGKIDHMADDSGNENYFVGYNNTANAEQSKILMPDDGSVANEGFITIYRNFTYDTHPKPDFGMGKVFQVEPLPGFGTEAVFEKNISGNNMLEFVGGTRWIYTYNEDGLPETIETKWKDIEISEPILLKIKYRKRNIGL